MRSPRRRAGTTPKVDPLTLAVWYQRDFDRLGAALLKTFGRLPSEIGEQTPHQLYDAAFGQAAKAVRAPERGTPLAALADVNRKRAAKGMAPVGQLFGKVLEHIPDV